MKAPYSQGDVVVFGQNAGQECVVMSLWLTVLEEDYQLEYSESYSPSGEPTIEGYQYCMGLKRAFESLISK